MNITSSCSDDGRHDDTVDAGSEEWTFVVRSLCVMIHSARNCSHLSTRPGEIDWETDRSGGKPQIVAVVVVVFSSDDASKRWLSLVRTNHQMEECKKKSKLSTEQFSS